ncbi:23S rRNA (guanosine(2251)-2'-O)-methyltransferase RlmB [Prochlorococcus sp. MIT 1300]|uniref:23S rRNA (guanosine(2251)-2'-O)-methyltransferase RlmB n=1 Tax=Prochlorococcus sp. MIT 1300 TaxID=3096218 RepID=UPI002A758394|nr:23S rRNA (guanosine(2251)-2'-O)-methyltransferase RlmB [Prochlorococcus sp. MIT 1300]
MSSRPNRPFRDSSRPGSSGGGRKTGNGSSSRRRFMSEASPSANRGYRSRRSVDGPSDFSEGAKQENYRPNRRNQDKKTPFKSSKGRASNGVGLRRGTNHEEGFVRPGNQRRRGRQFIRDQSENFDKPKSSGFTRQESSNSPEANVFSERSSNDLIWGRHSTQAVLESGRPIHRIWCTSDLRSAPKFLQLLRDAKSLGVLVEEVSWARLGQLTSGGVHQGIALQTAAAETLDLATLIKGCSEVGESPLLLALDGLTDPQNLGAIVRSAEALGAHGLVLPQRRSAGLTGSVAKVAAGALEHLPVARVVNLNRSLETLKDAGYRVIGLAEQGDTTISEVDIDGPLVLVTGSENQGISVVTRRHCDQLVRIPLRGVTPSLNASVATAMFLYEVARRGWMKEITGQAPSPRLIRAKCPSSPESEIVDQSFNKTNPKELNPENTATTKEDKAYKRENELLGSDLMHHPSSVDPSKEIQVELAPDQNPCHFDQSINL